MINADVLTFQEFMTHETLPLSQIHGAVLEFLQGRDDVVLFGAYAVNAYVSEPRMTQDVDLLSTNAEELAEELREYLNDKFEIAIRVREVANGKGFRVYQKRKEGNRHLVDVRLVAEFPTTEIIENISILSPAELIASKIVSYQSRKGQPKAGTDWRDLAFLLLKFPELKTEKGEVFEILQDRKVGENVLNAWREIVDQDLQIENEDEDLIF
ncbi:MAG: nucleotidyl transferase AbiEii/AbiGii toxin family protein [Aridibacter sp.]